MTRRRDYLMTPYFLNGRLPQTGSVDGICQQTDYMNRFYLDVKTGPYNPGLASKQIKVEESTGADLVSAVNVRANPAAARPERLPNSQNYSTVTPQPMI